MKLSALHTLLFTVALAGCAASNHAAPAPKPQNLQLNLQPAPHLPVAS
ncbi:hypothetical protein VRC35_11995 [Erwinia aphidicola]